MKQITVFVLAGNSQGEIEMLAYDLQVTQEQYDNGDHCLLAEEKAGIDGYHVVGKFDSNEPAARQITGKSPIYGDEARYLSEISKTMGGVVAPAVALSPGKEALIKIFGNDGEYLKYPRDDWTYEVENKDTQRGYWEWVDACIERDSSDTDEQQLFDRLFANAVDGLMEYCPSLSDEAMVEQIKATVLGEMVMTGNEQEDYTSLRNLVEQESQRAERTDQLHL